MKKYSKENIQTVLKMAWPSVLESFFVALVGMVDSLMVSRVGAHAVAAVGLTTQPKFIGLAMFIAVNVSVSALVARRKGQKNRRGANEVLCAASVFVLVMSVAVSLICVAFADPIIRLCGSEEASHAEAVQYFRIIMGFIIFTVVSLVVNAAQRGAGNTKIAMKTNVAANVVNVIFNYLLIEGHFGFPALGVSGAAIATVIGSVVGCVMSLVAACKGDFISIPYMWKEKIRPTLESAKSMIKIGSSVLAEQLLVRVGFLSVAVMAAKMGTAAFAAHQVGMNVMSLSFSFGDGMQVAAVALIGQSLGAKDVEMAKKIRRDLPEYRADDRRCAGGNLSVLRRIPVPAVLYGTGDHCHGSGNHAGYRGSGAAADCPGYLYGLPAGRGRCDLYHHRFHHQRNNCKAHCQLSALLYRRAGNYRYLVRCLRRSAGAVYIDEPAV